MSVLKQEFKLKNFALNHPNPELLLTSRWHKPHIISKWYLAVRWILALYHVSWLIFIFVDYPTPRCYFFIYLTQWSFVVLTATTVVWCAVETLAYVKFVKEGYITKRVGWSLKLLWTLQNITLMPAFFVSLVYWIFLFEPGSDTADFKNIEVHGLNSVYCLLEIFLSATPIRLLHIYQPVIYLLLYVFFSVIYFLAGGTTYDGDHAIYPVLDWEDVGPTLVFIVGGTLTVFVLQFIVWGLSQARELIYRKLVSQETNDDLELPVQNLS